VARFRLKDEAVRDLDEIWEFTVERWSVVRAQTYLADLEATFELIAQNPYISRPRPELSPPAHLHHHRSHIIMYRVDNGDIVIERVLHERQNWIALLTSDSRP